MRSSALIRYDLRELRFTLTGLQAVPGYDQQCASMERKIAKLQADLIKATRRELKCLAKTLTYKADVYHPDIGRIFHTEAKWYVDGDKLYHGVIRIDPAKLTDGHGRPIT